MTPLAEAIALADRIQAALTDRFKRAVPIENELFERASGKRPLPTADDCRRMAVTLGTPEKHPSFFCRPHCVLWPNCSCGADKSATPPASEVEKRGELQRECDDADRIIAALGLTVEQARTEGGSLNVPRIVNHINETLSNRIATPPASDEVGYTDGGYSEAYVTQLRNALRDCLTLARRARRHDARLKSPWDHIIRFCKEAGIEPSPFRASPESAPEGAK